MVSFPRVVLEVCVDSVQSAINAVNAGADRLELCGNLGVGGGTTPSIGLLKSVVKAVPSIPIMAMVRPRSGDFLYSDLELDVMLQDIQTFKQNGAHGVVFGILTAEGRIDIDRTKKLVDLALPMQVCFHRAFDMTRNPLEALHDVLSIGGISRVLTSGHGPTVLDSLETLAALQQEMKCVGGGELVILPGSGVNISSISRILVALLPEGLRELHMSGGSWVDGSMKFRRLNMGMGISPELEWSVWETNESSVKSVRAIVDADVQQPMS